MSTPPVTDDDIIERTRALQNDVQRILTRTPQPDAPPAPAHYLVRMTTLRGVFYLCSNPANGICGWTTSPLHKTVSRYRMLHAARRTAQLKWNEINQMFDPTAVEVVTATGETVWQAQDGGQAEPWRTKA